MFHFSMICSDFLPGSNVAHIENKETHVNKNRSRFFRLFLNIGRIKSFFGIGHPAPDRAASRSSILNVAFFGAMTQLRGTPLTQRHLFWLEEFLFSSEALNFRVPLS